MKQKFKTNMDKVEQIHNGRKCVMLAHGESGHAHAFYDTDIVEYNEGELKIKANGAKLEHEEHTTHEFEVGNADVDIQREYSMGDLRRVAD